MGTRASNDNRRQGNHRQDAARAQGLFSGRRNRQPGPSRDV